MLTIVCFCGGRLSMQSRCALLGKNGAGKTTFMKLVIGELQATEGVGSIWTHRNLRMAYVAQHSMVSDGQHRHSRFN
jgi:elongation factor 3